MNWRASIEQYFVTLISKLVQKTNPKTTTVPHWAMVAIGIVMSVGSIPFDSKTTLEAIIVALCTALPIFAILFHRAGQKQATVTVAPVQQTIAGFVVQPKEALVPSSLSPKITTLPRQTKTYSTVQVQPRSDYAGIMQSMPFPPKGTLVPSSLSPKEAQLLSLLVAAGKHNRSELVSAMNKKGIGAKNLMAQAARCLIAKYPAHLAAFDGAEESLAAQMVADAGGDEQAMSLANDILLADAFGDVPEPEKPVVQQAPVAMEPDPAPATQEATVATAATLP